MEALQGNDKPAMHRRYCFNGYRAAGALYFHQGFFYMGSSSLTLHPIVFKDRPFSFFFLRSFYFSPIVHPMWVRVGEHSLQGQIYLYEGKEKTIIHVTTLPKHLFGGKIM